MVVRLATLLNLTTAQQTQATAIFESEQSAMASLQTNIQTAHTSLTAAVKANQSATIDTLATQLGTYEAQALSTQSKAQAAFYAILTADQQTKYDSLHGAAGGRGPGAAFRGPRPPQQ